MLAPRFRPLALAAALVLLLGACSDDDDGGAADATTTTEADAPDAGGSDPEPVIDISVNPGTSEGYEGARDDVTELTCGEEDGTWAASGTVTNSADAAASYRIYVSFVREEDDSTAGLVQVDVEAVEPGESSPWSGELELAEDGLGCTLRVERTLAD